MNYINEIYMQAYIPTLAANLQKIVRERGGSRGKRSARVLARERARVDSARKMLTKFRLRTLSLSQRHFNSFQTLSHDSRGAPNLKTSILKRLLNSSL